MEHFLAQLLAGEDRGAHLGEARCRRCGRWDVGVDESADGRALMRLIAAETSGELAVLGINHQDARRAREHADAAASRVLWADQDPPNRTGDKVRRDLLGDDFDLAVVLPGRARSWRASPQRNPAI